MVLPGQTSECIILNNIMSDGGGGGGDYNLRIPPSKGAPPHPTPIFSFRTIPHRSLQARSKQILTGQARKWAGQRGVSGSNYIASLKIQNYQNDISYEQPIDKTTIEIRARATPHKKADCMQ